MNLLNDQPKQLNRESWLELGVERLNELFVANGYQLPRVKVSCGFTSNRGSKKVIGVCWNGKATDNNIAQIYIVPTLDDATRVLDILAHELIHALRPEAGHGKKFKEVALAIGLTGKMTATIAGPELQEQLEKIVTAIGPYPHGKLNPSNKKKQSTRMIKLVCEKCDYTVRTSNKWIDIGVPSCCCGAGEMEIAPSKAA